MTPEPEQFFRVVRLDSRGRFVKSYGVVTEDRAAQIATASVEKHRGGKIIVEPVKGRSK